MKFVVKSWGIPQPGHPKPEDRVLNHALTLAQAQARALIPVLNSANQHHQRLHTALLLRGPEGCGMDETAAVLVATLFCKSPRESGKIHLPCGACLPCKKWEWGNVPDLRWFDPEMDSDTGRVGVHNIDALRALVTESGHGPVEAPFKAVVITQIERFKKEGANSLLKLIEEPPQGWQFFFTTSQPDKVIATIRSRTSAVRLQPLPADTLQQVLSELDPDLSDQKKASVARISCGNVHQAVRLCQKDFWELRQLALACCLGERNSADPLSQKLATDRRKHHFFADWIETFFVDVLKTQHQKSTDPILNADATRQIQAWLDQGVNVLDKMERVQELRRWIDHPVNIKILSERWVEAITI